jgi:hypothetical protein
MFDWLATALGVPSGLVRVRLPGSGGRFAHALELFGLGFVRGLDDQLENIPELVVSQPGWQAYAHWNATLRLSSRWRIHGYVGTTVDSYQRYTTEDGPAFSERIYRDYVHLDLGAAVELSSAPWSKIHLNLMRGNTLYFVDQTPQKWKAVFRVDVMTPFSATGGSPSRACE